VVLWCCGAVVLWCCGAVVLCAVVLCAVVLLVENKAACSIPWCSTGCSAEHSSQHGGLQQSSGTMAVGCSYRSCRFQDTSRHI
jgi:hypothetical protein